MSGRRAQRDRTATTLIIAFRAALCKRRSGGRCDSSVDGAGQDGTSLGISFLFAFRVCACRGRASRNAISITRMTIVAVGDEKKSVASLGPGDVCREV